MSNFDTFARVTGGISGTAPEIFVATTDDLSSAVLTAGYVSDLFSAGIIKAMDVIFINYDMDGTPGQDVYTVTATSGGSLVVYPNATGGALLAANNLSDVASVPTSRTNLGLGTASDVVFGSLTLPNGGLHLLDTNASHDLIISPGSDLTADRILTITTGDAARTIDISAASLTLSVFGASLVDDASNLLALTTLGLKRGDSDTWGGGGTSFAFTCAGIVATDVVFVEIIASANAVSIVKAVAGAGTITVDFSADPGAGTILNFLGIPTV